MKFPVQHVEQEKLVLTSKKETQSECSSPSTFPIAVQHCSLLFLFVTLLFVISPSWAAQDWERESTNALLQGNWGKVAEIATQWKASGTHPATTDWLQGYASLVTGNYSRATEGFSRLDSQAKGQEIEAFAAGLVKENPQSAVAFMLHGDALARVGKYDEALAFLNRAVSLDSQSALIYNTRGVIKALASKPQEAMSDFTEATRLSPEFADAYANQGLLRLAQGEQDQAVANFSTAIERAPDFALAYHGRGIARMQANDYDGALTDLERTGQLPLLGSTPWLEANRQALLQNQARFTLQQHLADLRSGRLGNESMSFNYDKHEKLTSLKDVFGGETRYSYTPKGNLSRITHPDGKWTEYRYYDNGSLREMLTENGRRISYTHGAKGEWTQIEFPNHDAIRIVQDPSARSVTFSFPDGDTTRYQFDQQQRLAEVRTADLTRTVDYEPSGQVRQLKWSNGDAVNFQYDTDNRIRSLRDQTGQELQQWDVTLHTDERGQVTSVTDPLERTRLQWDDAGRLKSATSDAGAKVLVHWNSETNKPRSLTTSWGYVEFDDQGRPQDLYTIEGQRRPATWKADGQLEHIMTPLFGAIRLRSQTPNRPAAIQFPGGLSTTLDWGKRDLARTRDRQFAQRDLESTKFREPPRPLSSTRFNEAKSWQYRFEMPRLPADRFATQHSGRFWSRVQELVDRSAQLPMPSEQEMQRHEEYWTKGEYWTKDPYYADLARPMPEFSAESYAKAFVLTVGVIALDWTRFALEVPRHIPGANFLVRPFIERIPTFLQRGVIQNLRQYDPNNDILGGLAPAGEQLREIGQFVGNLNFIQELSQSLFRISPWYKTTIDELRSQHTLIARINGGPSVVATQSISIRSIRSESGYTHWIDMASGAKTGGKKLVEHNIGERLDEHLLPKPQGPHKRNDPTPTNLKVFSFHVDQPTGKVTQMQERTLQSFGDHNDPARRTPSFTPRRGRGTCGEGLDCPPPTNRSTFFPPPPPPPPGAFAHRSDHSVLGSSRPSISFPERPPSLTSPPLASMSGPTARNMDRPVPAATPSYRLPSSQRPQPDVNGVSLPAQVVKNQPPDMSDMFGTAPSTPPVTPPRTQTVAAQPDRLFTPFLLFCTVEEAQ